MGPSSSRTDPPEIDRPPRSFPKCFHKSARRLAAGLAGTLPFRVIRSALRLTLAWVMAHTWSMATVFEGDFEWDSAKAASNLVKHGISFPEAATVFADPFAVYLDDGSGTDRMVVIGTSLRERVLFVVHVERGERDRIISARRATPGEREVYETGG